MEESLCMNCASIQTWPLIASHFNFWAGEELLKEAMPDS